MFTAEAQHAAQVMREFFDVLQKYDRQYKSVHIMSDNPAYDIPWIEDYLIKFVPEFTKGSLAYNTVTHEYRAIRIAGASAFFNARKRVQNLLANQSEMETKAGLPINIYVDAKKGIEESQRIRKEFYNHLPENDAHAMLLQDISWQQVTSLAWPHRSLSSSSSSFFGAPPSSFPVTGPTNAVSADGGYPVSAFAAAPPPSAVYVPQYIFVQPYPASSFPPLPQPQPFPQQQQQQQQNHVPYTVSSFVPGVPTSSYFPSSSPFPSS